MASSTRTIFFHLSKTAIMSHTVAVRSPSKGSFRPLQEPPSESVVRTVRQITAKKRHTVTARLLSTHLSPEGICLSTVKLRCRAPGADCWSGVKESQVVPPDRMEDRVVGDRVQSMLRT